MKKMFYRLSISGFVAIMGFAFIACGGESEIYGVDEENKILTIGYLDDMSGPGAQIGRNFAIGKRILTEQVNSGEIDILPEGWTIEMVERDHAYNPQRSLEAFREIQDRVLFIGTVFGTPNTLPLRPLLEREKVVAFPASLSSLLAENRYTPPIGTSYEMEARRGVDWLVQEYGAEEIKAGIVYQNDDYGQDGLNGFRAQAELHGVEIVTEQSVAPGQRDFIAVVTALKEAGATHVHVAVLPTGTGPLLGTAAQTEYMPIWIGNTPAWVDQFFNPDVIPSQVFANFHLIYSLPYWGEEVPGMSDFIQAFEQYGEGDPDFYILLSYVQGLIQLEAFATALENGDISREGYARALNSMENVDMDGMIQPIDLSEVPYVTSTESRILKPSFANRSWTVIDGYKSPEGL